MVSDTILDKCPFCGGKSEIHHFKEKPTARIIWHKPRCTRCPATFSDSYRTEREATYMWNQRHGSARRTTRRE